MRPRSAYSSEANRAYLRRRGIQAVIPVNEDRKAHRRTAAARAAVRWPSTVDGTRNAIPSNFLRRVCQL